MTVLQKIARRISPTRFGRWAMDTGCDLTLLKARQGVRTYVGIAMIMLSFMVGIPGVVVCGFLARKFHEPVILVLGGSAAMVLNYALFGVGIYLAGGNYASFLLRWCARKFIRRFSGSPEN
jgi:hypothetical protein